MGSNESKNRMNPADPTVDVIITIIKRIFGVGAAFGLFVIFLIPFLIGLTIYGRPPIIPSLSSFIKMFQYSLNNVTPARNYTSYKIRLILFFIQTLFLQPMWGCLWFLDDVLFPGYRSMKIEEPLLIIGDARTGTTQYVQNLAEDNQNFCAPITLNALVPYILPWKFGATVASFLPPQLITTFEELFEKIYMSWLPIDFQQRHEGTLWKADTFEVQYDAWRVEFFKQCINLDLVKHNWWFPEEEQRVDFLRFLHAVWQKVKYHRGRGPNQRMLIKGHFLKEGEFLAQTYPNAKFVALAREPGERLRSTINFLWYGPWPPQLGVPQVPLDELTRVLTDRVIEYSEEEKRFFNDSQLATRRSIPFELYVQDLTSAIKVSYDLCGIKFPESVSKRISEIANSHRTWSKTRPPHSPDFSLEELGVDVAGLQQKHASYLTRTKIEKK